VSIGQAYSMYGNDYPSLAELTRGLAPWLGLAAAGGAGIAHIQEARLRRKLAVWWSLLPGVGTTALCIILYLVVPDDRYMSPVGGHWLVMLLVAVVLSLVLIPPWALAVWLSLKAVRRFRGNAPSP
jgi:hypothetical protein